MRVNKLVLKRILEDGGIEGVQHFINVKLREAKAAGVRRAACIAMRVANNSVGAAGDGASEAAQEIEKAYQQHYRVKP